MDGLERAVAELDLPAELTADWLGRLDKVIRTLTGLKRSLMVEVEHDLEGTNYRVVEGRKADRSYNTAGLLHAFTEKGWTLQDLVRQDAARIQWQWTNLKRAAEQADVTLSVTHHEVEDEGDVDGTLVGEVWGSYWQIKGVDG